MKKTIFLLTLILAITGQVRAQSASQKFQGAMYKKVLMLDTARTSKTVTMLFDDFKRIAAIEKKEWLPYYYMAYCKVRLSAGEGDKKKADEILEEAKIYLASADELNKDNIEILSLKSRIALSKIPLGDIMERAPKYSAIAKMYAENALEKDPTNPRAHLIMGMYYSFLPTMLGGNPDKACEHYHVAKEDYKVNKRPVNDFSPYWGEVLVDDFLLKCSK